MTTIDTIHGLLHDDKYKSARGKLETIIIVFMLSGSWAGAGYILGNRDRTESLAKIEMQYNAKLADERDKFGKELDNLRLTCAKKEIGKP